MTSPTSLPPGLERQFGPDLDLPQSGERVLVWLGGRALEGTCERHAVIRNLGTDAPGLLVQAGGLRAVLPADRVTRIRRDR